ncbi:MAG TPA: amidohydrolase family protein [Caulobacteraceae bacterium]|jgi:predicted TIM-barrel fold metal-dependent hydrolase
MSVAAHDKAALPGCLPPRPAQPPASFEVPRGAWDTHAHVIGGGPDAPFVAQRSYTPPPASVDAYVSMLDAAGVDFGVLVQISVHGADNRLIADGLRSYPQRLRGVISIDGGEDDAELEALRDLGVCGIRLNEHFAGGAGADHLERLADRCRPLGWHVDLGVSAARLRELAPRLARLDLPVVIDHMGAPSPASGVDHADFAAAIELANLDHCWIKLSGAYRFSEAGAPYDDLTPFVGALIAAAPKRTIWAADWPNVALSDPARMPQTGAQLDALARQIGDANQLHAVLVDNPLALFGRPGTSVRLPAHG